MELVEGSAEKRGHHHHSIHCPQDASLTRAQMEIPFVLSHLALGLPMATSCQSAAFWSTSHGDENSQSASELLAVDGG